MALVAIKQNGGYFLRRSQHGPLWPFWGINAPSEIFEPTQIAPCGIKAELTRSSSAGKRKRTTIWLLAWSLQHEGLKPPDYHSHSNSSSDTDFKAQQHLGHFWTFYFMMWVLIRQWRLRATCGLADRINAEDWLSLSCTLWVKGGEWGGWGTWRGCRIKRLLTLTTAVCLIRVVPAVIDPVAEAAICNAALVVARPEALSTAPVDWTQQKQARTPMKETELFILIV